jgi:hypothetical protein
MRTSVEQDLVLAFVRTIFTGDNSLEADSYMGGGVAHFYRISSTDPAIHRRWLVQLFDYRFVEPVQVACWEKLVCGDKAWEQTQATHCLHYHTMRPGYWAGTQRVSGPFRITPDVDESGQDTDPAARAAYYIAMPRLEGSLFAHIKPEGSLHDGWARCQTLVRILADGLHGLGYLHQIGILSGSM